jgi:preprotein translocase subunit SecY
MPVLVISQVLPDLRASCAVKRGFALLYPVQACRTVTGFKPQSSAASVTLITSSNGSIVFAPMLVFLPHRFKNISIQKATMLQPTATIPKGLQRPQFPTIHETIRMPSKISRFTSSAPVLNCFFCFYYSKLKG